MMIAPAQYRRFAKWWRHGHIRLLLRALATRILCAVLSGSTLTCAAEHAIPGGATISSNAGHQCLHVWAQDELLGEFAARLTVSSGIDIVVSESIMATPVSALVEAVSWEIALAQVFANYSIVVKADPQGHWRRVYLLSAGSADAFADDTGVENERQATLFPGLDSSSYGHPEVNDSEQSDGAWSESAAAGGLPTAEQLPYAGIDLPSDEPVKPPFVADALKSHRGVLPGAANAGAPARYNGNALVALFNTAREEGDSELSPVQAAFIEKLKAATLSVEAADAEQRGLTLPLQDLLQRVQ